MDEEVESYHVGEVLPVIILEDNNQELVRFIGEKTVGEIIEGIKKYEK